MASRLQCSGDRLLDRIQHRGPIALDQLWLVAAFGDEQAEQMDMGLLPEGDPEPFQQPADFLNGILPGRPRRLRRTQQHRRLGGGPPNDLVEYRLFVAKVPVDRTDGDLPRGRDLLDGGASISVSGEEPESGGPQLGRSSLAATFPPAPSGW
jgi:hypothetical protein